MEWKWGHWEVTLHTAVWLLSLSLSLSQLGLLSSITGLTLTACVTCRHSHSHVCALHAHAHRRTHTKMSNHYNFSLRFGCTWKQAVRIASKLISTTQLHWCNRSPVGPPDSAPLQTGGCNVDVLLPYTCVVSVDTVIWYCTSPALSNYGAIVNVHG